VGTTLLLTQTGAVFYICQLKRKIFSLTYLMNWLLIGSLALSIILLFIGMMFSSWAASDASNKDADDAHKWAMYTAIMNGVAVLGIAIALGVYIYYTYRKTGSF
jgi:uncharacterized membrane protein (DUF441 family)